MKHIYSKSDYAFLDDSKIKYSINPNGSVNINGTLNLRHKQFTDGEIPVKINYASGVLVDNCGLKSIKNLPRKISETYSDDISGYYWINENEIESLIGCPKKVKRFIASNNKIKSLEGAPEYVHDACILNDNNIESMEYCPKYIGLTLHIWNNPIKSIIGIPPDLMVDCSEWKTNRSITNYKVEDGIYRFEISKDILDEYWNYNLEREPSYFKYLFKSITNETTAHNTCAISSKLWTKFRHLDLSNKTNLWDMKGGSK